MKIQILFHKLLLTTVSLFLFCLVAMAEERELGSAAADKIDAVLVLDTSGSMLVTDPLKLREEGAKLFTQFLKPGDRLAIVSFADNAKVVRELRDYSSDQLPAISSEISGMQNNGEYTNILDGVSIAKKILENNHREGANPAIILLSDGKMEPPPSAGSADTLTQELVETVLSDLKKNGTKVYTLCFSEQADKDLLQEIAAQSDGINWYTPTADKIHESFANLFLAVKKPQVVPLTKRGFKIDADVQEATFYMNRENADGEITLIKPDGTKITAQTTDPTIKWFSGQKFEVATVTTPPAGDWQITGVTMSDGFATVLTKLRLVTEWPVSSNAQEKTLLEARLYEEDKPVALPEMSGVIKYGFQIVPTDKVSEPIVRDFLYDDGTHGDRVERDGIFSSEVEIEDVGEYKLRVLAKAPTFERNQQIPFRVKPPLLSLSIVAHDADEGLEIDNAAEQHGDHGDSGEHGDTGHSASTAKDHLRLTISDEVLNLRKVALHLYAVDEKRTRYEITMSPVKNSKTQFEASVLLLPSDGTFKLQATLSGENKRNQEIKAQSRPLTYKRITTAEEKEEVQIVVPKKVEAPPSVVLPIILMTLLNLGAAGGIMNMQKKRKTGTDEGMPVLASIEEYQTAFNNLRARIEVSDLNFDDPVFSDDSYALPETWKGIGMEEGLEPAVSNASPEVDEDSGAQAPEGEEPAPEEAGEEG